MSMNLQTIALGLRGQTRIDQEALMVIDVDGLHHLREQVEEAIAIGTGKDIDHMVAIAEAEAELEVHGEIAHHSLAVLPAEK
jgi:hypothetical protein